MLTIFTAPRGFEGEYARLQRNAMGSWQRLPCEVQLLLMGTDPGVGEMSAEIGAEHVPEIARNAHGTPLINDLFEKAAQFARWSTLAYVNADIILLDDFIVALRQILAQRKLFLMVGQRRNVQLEEQIEFDPGWRDRLRRLALESCDYGRGLDYFVFPRMLFPKIPPFALGRAYWDDWFVYAARLRKAAVVDVTETVLAIHQNHNYPSYASVGPVSVSKGPEMKRNYELLGRPRNRFTCWEATHVLKGTELQSRCRSCYPVCVCQLDSVPSL